MKKYDLIIIGGGAGAFAASNTANKLKKKTLMINDSKILPLGGTCVNVGCMPSKIMLYQGHEYYYSTHSKFKSIKLKGNIDFITALKDTRNMVKEFRKKNYSNVIKKQKYVEFIDGKGKFIDKNTVEVNGEKFIGKNIIIATGASTFVPEIKGIDNVPYLTNANVFDLKKKPKSLIIIGGGPQAMEFSQIFNHFGIKVTVLQRSRILKKMDSIIGEELKKHLEKEGVTIHTKVDFEEVKKTSKGIEINILINGKKKKIISDLLFLGTGLSPHTNIDSGKAGVKLDKKGFIKVNKFMQTSQNNIYAVGDVNGFLPLETVAAKEGSIAASNIFKNTKKTINYNEIPSAVFTSPEVAVVGITEEEYAKKHGTCLCSTIKLEHVEKALAIKDIRGVIRMILDHKTKRVVGVEIVSPMAADIITTAVYAIKNKMTIDDIRDTVHVFPTMSEMIKKVAQSFNQNLDDMACCVE
ncbi:MAG TPA: mercury(II) reductase [Ignavibacteria bacterium]|nr:mercury(II) reductase [Ignavibacteria bacterium]